MVELGSFNNFYKAAFSLNLVFHSPQVSLTRVFHLSIWCFNLVHSLNLSFCFRYAFSIDGVIKVTCYIWSSQTQSSYVKRKDNCQVSIKVSDMYGNDFEDETDTVCWWSKRAWAFLPSNLLLLQNSNLFFPDIRILQRCSCPWCIKKIIRTKNYIWGNIPKSPFDDNHGPVSKVHNTFWVRVSTPVTKPTTTLE